MTSDIFDSAVKWLSKLSFASQILLPSGEAVSELLLFLVFRFKLLGVQSEKNQI